MRFTRIPKLLAVFALLAAACGGDDGGAPTSAAGDIATTTTAAPPATTTSPPTTTTAAPPTTTAETTTTVAETTTTGGDTTQAPADGPAAEITMAKATAAEMALPEDWSSSISTEFVSDEGADDVFAPCTPDDAFDVSELDSVTAAVATLMADGPPPEGSFFPGGSASIEARVFESEEVAAQAFEVLETTIGSDEGRECLAEQFLDLMAQDVPDDEGEFEFSIVPLDVPGAQAAATIVVDMSFQGLAFQFQIDLASARDGVCTVYGTFLSFGGPFDPAVREALFAAANEV